MALQHTIQDSIHLSGIDLYGGSQVQITISPADVDTGIVFQTPNGNLQANIAYASQSKSSLLLKNNDLQVLNFEHLLATLFAYGVDNAYIEAQRIPSKSFNYLKSLGLATKIYTMPTCEDREKLYVIN